MKNKITYPILYIWDDSEGWLEVVSVKERVSVRTGGKCYHGICRLPDGEEVSFTFASYVYVQSKNFDRYYEFVEQHRSHRVSVNYSNIRNGDGNKTDTSQIGIKTLDLDCLKSITI